MYTYYNKKSQVYDNILNYISRGAFRRILFKMLTPFFFFNTIKYKAHKYIKM